MSDTVIRVDRLSKRYTLAHQRSGSGLRHLLHDLTTAPFRRFSRRGGNGKGGAPQAAESEEFWALRDVSFEVKRGEVVGVIGRNGAGKSTLLKILSRITEPTSGRIEIDGRVASLLEVGTGFHAELTGRENIFLNGAILGMARAEVRKKFDEIVAFAEVEKFLDTPVKRYSSGMYVRLAFAVAAHLEPEILIIDEVLAVGDVQFQKKCLGKMRDVSSQQGRTVLFVSHNMAVIGALCSRCVLLSKGNVAEIGQAARVIESYFAANRFHTDGNLEACRDPNRSSEVVFESIELTEAREHNYLFFGESPAFEFVLKANLTKTEVNVGASIYRFDGGCVGTLFAPGSFSINAGERRKFRLVVNDVKLAPGRYYMGFGVGTGGPESVRHDFDVIIGTPTFEVMPIPASASAMSNWLPEWGSLVLDQVAIEEIKL